MERENNEEVEAKEKRGRRMKQEQEYKVDNGWELQSEMSEQDKTKELDVE